MQYYEQPNESPFANFSAWIPLILTAIDTELNTPSAFPESWETAQGLIQDLLAVVANLNMSMTPIGAITAFAGTTPPEGYVFCDGRLISRTVYANLFSVIGTTYGVGDGSTTFALPDLRGRVVLGVGQGSGLSNRVLGDTIGTETHVLTVDQMPAHGHQIVVTNNAGSTVGRLARGNTGTIFSNGNTVVQGMDEAHPNMQPSIALNYIIYANA